PGGARLAPPPNFPPPRRTPRPASTANIFLTSPLLVHAAPISAGRQLSNTRTGDHARHVVVRGPSCETADACSQVLTSIERWGPDRGSFHISITLWFPQISI